MAAFVFQAAATLAKGIGEAKGFEYDAERAKLAQEVAEVQADQIDATYRDELATTVANIRAIQASSGAPIDSQATMAFIRGEERASDRDRRLAVTSARLQAGQYGLDAIAFRRAARMARIGAFLGAGVSLAQAASGRPPQGGG